VDVAVAVAPSVGVMSGSDVSVSRSGVNEAVGASSSSERAIAVSVLATAVSIFTALSSVEEPGREQAIPAKTMNVNTRPRYKVLDRLSDLIS
jgi:hypothetical protein